MRIKQIWAEKLILRGHEYFYQPSDALYNHHSINVTLENSSLLNSASEWNGSKSMEAKKAASVNSRVNLAGYLIEADSLRLTTLIMRLSMLHGELGSGFSKPPFPPNAPSFFNSDNYPGSRVTKMIVWPMT